MNNRSLLVTLPAAVYLLAAGPAPAREYSQIVTVNDYSYEIQVEGYRDPVNETIIIENLDYRPVVNPRITVNGRFDWFDVQSMAAEATRGCSTDKEKALAIWEFIRTNFQHLASPGDRQTHNPVIALNVYGYANCAFHASSFVALCEAVGVKARVWEVHSHTVSEAWYENAWHMLDSDIGLYYLMDDNRTIASVEQLWADQKVSEGLEEKANLTKYSGRNKAIFLEYTDAEGNNAYVSQDGVRQRGYRYFHDNYYCFVQKGYEKFTNAAHTMAITLRPNEKIIRNWKGGDKFYDYERHKRDYERNNSPESVPIRYGDGKLIWKTDLASKDACLYVNREFPPAFMADDGQYPPIHVKHRQGGIYDFPTRAFFDISSPYTILGGRLRATVHRGGASEWDGIETVIYNEEKELNERVWQAPQDTTGKLEMDVSLNETLYPSGQKGLHDYSVQFQFSANEKNDPPTQTGIESVEFKTDIQVAPNSLPALTLGRNVIRYRDETPGPHRVKITHVWRERSDNHPPLAPAVALYPADGVTVDDLAPNFRWKSAADQDRGDSIANHWIRISFDPQCRWPVATALMKVTDSPKSEWQIDPGWLNHDTVYYWQVKARDSRGVWGDWGPVFRFRTAVSKTSASASGE